MRTLMICGILVAVSILVWTSSNTIAVAQVNGNDNKIAVTDDCLPTDQAWNPTGGCGLKPHQGDVPLAEFLALLTSPLTIPPNGQLIGHPSWRNEPSHVTARLGSTIRVTNTGGRGHTFTKVADFGGGFVPLLNVGLTQAPQCTPASTIALAPGATIELKGLAQGLHKYQCCIHPWMRATIRVE